MSSSNQPQSDAQAGTIVVLIDESSDMAAPIAGGTKSKAESVATAVNSMLNQLTAGPDVRVAIVGYGGNCENAPAVLTCWAGSLAGRVFVSSSELPAAPVAIEERVRRIPGAGGVGVARQETIQFPVWYVPGQPGPGDFVEAVDAVSRQLAEAGSDTSGKAPLLLHICERMPTTSELQSEPVRALANAVLACHLHLGASDRIPATLYPSSNQFLAPGNVTALFDASSTLPDSMVGTLRTSQISLVAGARGFVHQAHMGDLIRFMTLAKAYVACEPAAFASVGYGQPAASLDPTPGTTPDIPSAGTAPASNVACDRLALIVMADRSQADPASGVWLRRQDQVNDIIAQIAKRNGGDVDVGLILYGAGAVEAEFGGPLQGRPLVADRELAAGALRSEQVTEKVSNGIGGLVELTRTRFIFVDCEPSPPTKNLDAVMPVLADLVQQARNSHEEDRVLPLVMHITGGGFSVEAVADASAAIAEMGDVVVYHSVVPERPQPTVAYPADADQITDQTTAALWQMTNALAGADKIAAKRKTITQASRGFVVGAKFDLLIDSIQAVLRNPEP